MNDKLIHDYLEGELDSADQEMLFAELNSSSMMREELDYQMKLNKIIEMDRNVSSTPTELTAALFNKLNYSIPLANNAKLISTKRSYFWRYAVAMLLLLFISIPAGIMVYDKYQNNEEIVGTSNSANSEINFAVDQKNNVEKFANVASSNVTNANANNSNQLNNSEIRSGNSTGNLISAENSNSNKGNYSNVMNKNDFQNTSYNSIAQEDATLRNSFTQVNNSYPENNLNQYWAINSIENSNIANNSNSIGMSLSPIIDDLLSLLSDDNFEININIKNNINNYPPSSLNVTSNVYDNMGLSLWYNFDKGLDAGLELGRVSFSQSFTTSDGLIYNQIPTLNYIGLGIRYSAYQLELPLESVPYFQFNAAASTIGPIFNIQSGLNIASYSKVSIRLGVEYSSLLYNVNSNIYNSSKVNLIGGIVYSF